MRTDSSDAVFRVLEEGRVIGTLRTAHKGYKVFSGHKAQAAKAVAALAATRAVYRYGEKKVMVRNPALARDHEATARAMSKIHADKALKSKNFISRRFHVKRAGGYAKGAKRYAGIAKLGDKKAAYHNAKIRKGLKRWAHVNEGVRLRLAKSAISSLNPVAHLSSARKIGKKIGAKVIGKTV
jgi:hypothetical protein